MPKYSTTYQTRRPPARPSTPSQNGPTRTAPGSASSGVMRHTAELGRIWSGRLSRGDERWPDASRGPLGLRKFSQHCVTVLLGKHPLEASLETTGCKDAKESPFVGSEVSQRVGYVLGRACPCARTTGNDLLANLQGQLTGEHVEGLRVRGMQVQRRPGDTRGEGHLHHTQSSVAVCFTQQDSQRLRDTRPPNDHARTTRHLKPPSLKRRNRQRVHWSVRFPTDHRQVGHLAHQPADCLNLVDGSHSMLVGRRCRHVVLLIKVSVISRDPPAGSEPLTLFRPCQ